MTVDPDRLPTLGFVIPAFNEAASIGRCLASIKRHCPPDLLHEIVLVDNGSTDGTAAIARMAGATVVRSDAHTIGAVRNEGEAHLSSEMVVFLDADCALTERWGQEIKPALDNLLNLPLACAGAQVSPPKGERVFLWVYWFAPFVNQRSASHIGSANMICLREAFQKVGRFDEALETGEDFELCERIKAHGGTILNLPELQVEHYGFPRTCSEFLERERWHGRGDAATFHAFLRSKVAVVSILFFVALVVSAAAAALGWALGSILAFGLAFALVLGSSAKKFGHAGPAAVLAGMIVFPVYFAGRSLAVLDIIRQSIGRGRLSRR